MENRISIPRSTVDIFFVLLAIVFWIPAYYLYSHATSEHDMAGFGAEILKDLGVIIAGLALVDRLWTLFSGDPVERGIAQLRSQILDSIDIVSHARNCGVVRIDTSPTALDAGFPTDHFKDARVNIDLCGMTLHSLFARGDLISALKEAVRRGCHVRICIASHDNSTVLENSLPGARSAMPGQSTAVIEAVETLRVSLTTANSQGKLLVRVLSKGAMTAFISRIDERMLVVPYLRSAFTMDSPATLVEDTKAPRSIFATYLREFEYLLDQSTEVHHPAGK
jgi:hypothetical protein